MIFKYLNIFKSYLTVGFNQGVGFTVISWQSIVKEFIAYWYWPYYVSYLCGDLRALTSNLAGRSGGDKYLVMGANFQPELRVIGWGCTSWMIGFLLVCMPMSRLHLLHLGGKWQYNLLCRSERQFFVLFF